LPVSELTVVCTPSAEGLVVVTVRHPAQRRPARHWRDPEWCLCCSHRRPARAPEPRTPTRRARPGGL